MGATLKSLKKMFAGKEAEVVEKVREVGLDSAMAMYGLKHRGCFLKWLRDNTDEEWKADSSPLAGLSGGDKAKWDREHRDTILDCLEVFGVDWVKANFRFSHDTLEGIIGSDHHPFTGYDKKLTRLERAELQAKEALKIGRQIQKQLEVLELRCHKNEEAYRESKSNQKHLEGVFDSFTDTTAKRLAGMITLFLQALLIPDQPLILKAPDELSIDSLIGQVEAYRKLHSPKRPQLAARKPR